MNKREITAKMSKDAGITHQQAEKAFFSLMDGIKGSLKTGRRVTFSGFGSFELKLRKERKGRNPKTGEIITIGPKKRIKFNTSKILKNVL
jgi:DNA-binding protein HU-beta